MSDELRTETITPQSVDPGLAAIISDVLDARDARNREDVKSTLAALATPQRQHVADILPTTDRESRDSRVRVIQHAARSRRYRDLYRKNPSVRECRNEEIDHWNHQFILSLADRNEARMRSATDAANSAYLRQFGVEGWDSDQRADAEDPSGWKGRPHARADILEGAVSGTDLLDGTGGFLLPQPFTQVLNLARERSSVIESLAMVYPMSSATLRIPTAGTATAAKVAEGGTPGDGESLYNSVLLKAEKNVVFMEASREFIADSAFNAVGLFADRAGMALGANADVDFLTSNGVAPNCTAALAGGAVAETTGTQLGFVDLSLLYRAVSQRDRQGPGCAWLGNTAMMGYLDTMLDLNGRPILSTPNQSPQAIGDGPGNEGFIYRWPVFEVPSAAGDLIFGNIRQGYAIGRREGVTARVSTDSAFKTGLVQFLIEERYDALVTEAAALKELQGITSAT